jgi:CubicO group peptidase (beta-lactamase class C family)
MTVNAFIKQHSVVSYYVLTFAISWGVVGWPRKRLQLEGSTSVVGQPDADAAVSRASCWLGRAVRGAVAAALLFGFATSIVPLGSAPPASAADSAATVIARYRERIPELMAEQGVPGLAVALVDGDRALWVEGFGYRDRQGGAPVTADTIFSVQSMSKLFTATAVMQAVAVGQLDLDEPITTYLPEFTVHSAFEEHPERKVTLRMLLSHTAGFTHEAPVGNNNELDPGDFDVHVRSISDTWLRFPVGSGYAYSNLGIDLAGYILERVEGKPFAHVMRDSLLGPLGMDHSTFDRTVIRSTDDRAAGNVDPYPAPPLDVPMTSAGGLYTSAADLARFLHFQLNDGSIDGRAILDHKSIAQMRTVPPPSAGAPAGCALGVIRTRWNRWDERPDLFTHGGGGYGFISDLWWLPQLHIGIAILTNSQDHQLQEDLALSILGDLVTEPGVYRDRLLALPPRPSVVDPSWSFQPPAGMANLVANAAMVATGDEATRWAAYSGPYRTPAWGVLDPTGPPDRFVVDAGVPYFEVDDTGSLVRHRLVEVAPGLFLADNGETLDLRDPVPTWQGLRLVRVAGGPAPWQWGILGTAALLAAAWLVAAAVRLVRRRGSRSASDQQPSPSRRWRRIAALTALVTAVLTLGNAALVAWMPGLVDSGFLGWLEFPVAQRLALHLPLALAVLGACTLVVVAAGWVLRWWSSALRLQYAVLAVAAVAVVAQLAAWRLIGWGVT